MQTIEARIQIESDSPADVPTGEYEVVLVLNQRSASAVDEAIQKDANEDTDGRVPPASIAGKGKTIGDIVSPIDCA